MIGPGEGKAGTRRGARWEQRVAEPLIILSQTPHIFGFPTALCHWFRSTERTRLFRDHVRFATEAKLGGRHRERNRDKGGVAAASAPPLAA
jgi:hypothetical protein